MLGPLAWYGVGYGLGTERLKRLAKRHGHWLTISESDVERAQQWFDRYGGAAVCIGRLIPAVRSVISAPAGIAQMGFVRFLCWSTLGTIVWTGALTGLGYVLGTRFSEVDRWLQPVSLAIIALAIVAYLYRAYRSNERA